MKLKDMEVLSPNANLELTLYKAHILELLDYLMGVGYKNLSCTEKELVNVLIKLIKEY